MQLPLARRTRRTCSSYSSPSSTLEIAQLYLLVLRRPLLSLLLLDQLPLLVQLVLPHVGGWKVFHPEIVNQINCDKTWVQISYTDDYSGMSVELISTKVL